jgi:hypothetical protein
MVRSARLATRLLAKEKVARLARGADRRRVRITPSPSGGAADWNRISARAWPSATVGS